MVNPPPQSVLDSLPELYAQEKIPIPEQIIHLRFFLANTDWWISEFDREEGLFYGFVCLGGDTINAEWGYIDYQEIKDLKVRLRAVNPHTGQEVRFPAQVEWDQHWIPKPFSEIEIG